MAHAIRKKKEGQRKDKKLERMRDAREQRLQNAPPPKPQSDTHDIQTYKPGAPSDKNRKVTRPNAG